MADRIKVCLFDLELAGFSDYFCLQKEFAIYYGLYCQTFTSMSQRNMILRYGKANALVNETKVYKLVR